MREVWIEKYRPRILDDICGQHEIVARLHAYVRTKNMPHLLFAGPAGVGKTTSALALARGMFGEPDWRHNFQELNASDERGIKIVRTKIKDFARTATIGENDFKIIFLDEADALTPEAQAALRRTMEKYTHTCRFILSCNYSSKIIDPIQSRCAMFRFRPLRPEDISSYLERIIEREGLDVKSDGMDTLLYIAAGDMRRAVNALQVAAAVTDVIDSESLYKTSSTARPEDVETLLTEVLAGRFLNARELLDKLLITYGLSGEDVIGQIHRQVFDLAIPDWNKVELVDKIGDIEFRMVEGSNERIQLEALLAYFALIGSRLQ